MKCTLVRCPQIFSRHVTAANAVAPLGLAYVAAALVRAGHAVTVIDPTGEAIDRFTPLGGELIRRGLTDDEILARIGNPDLIGFSLMFSQDWLVARALIERVRAAHPRVPLVAGGEHFSAEPVGALTTAPGLDYVLLGEGDRSLLDLIEHLDGSRNVDEVPGLYYRKPTGEIVTTGPAIRLRDIDDLPWPAWDLVPIEAYLAGGHGNGVNRGRGMPINTTRGCPYRCTFCSSPSMWTTRYVTRRPADVVAEMQHYVRTYHASNFDFQDLTATIRKDWVLELCERIASAGLAISWQLPGGTRSEVLDDDVLPALVRAGCTNVTYAPESGHVETLRVIRKKLDPDRMLVSMRRAVRAGCNVKANFVFGFPTDTYGSLFRSFAFLARAAVVGVHDISLAPYRPYPGSEIFRELQAKGTIPAVLDDAYYRDLAVTAETAPWARTRACSYSPSISASGLAWTQFLGLIVFFAISWALRPWRVALIVRALVTGKQTSRLDKSLAEIRYRLLRTWRAERGFGPYRAPAT